MGLFCVCLLSKSDVLKSPVAFAWKWLSHGPSASPIDIVPWMLAEESFASLGEVGGMGNFA